MAPMPIFGHLRRHWSPFFHPHHHLYTRQFRLPINTTTLSPYPYRFPPLRSNAQYRYHPAVEFILNLLRWIFHMVGDGPVKPKPPLDYTQAQEVVVKVWKWVLLTICGLVVMVLLLLLVIRVCVAYDRHQSKHGQVGVELARREDAMIKACEKKGRIVIERMERERVERIWREEDKRQAVRDEYLRRQSILQGKLPMLSMMREQNRKLGKEVIEGVGEGPAPRLEMGRSTSKREERRGEGTQVLSEEDDTLRKIASTRVPKGAEGRIGNSVWRSNSYKSIQRRDSAPQVFMRNKTLGRLGVKRNTSFKTGLQEQLDDVFGANTAGNSSVTDTLLEKHFPVGRALSFNKGKEILHVSGQTPIRTWSFNSGSETIHPHNEALKNELMAEKASNPRHLKGALNAQVEVDDMSPGPSMTAEVGRLEEERLDNGRVYDTATNSSITTSGASYHSAETTSLPSAVSHAAYQGSHLRSQSQHDDEEGLQPDHPLLGAHIRSNSTILYYPSPTVHPIAALSSVERLEEGVRSRSSIDAVSMQRKRFSTDIDTLYGRVEEGVNSRASVDTLHDTVLSRASADTLHDAMAALPRGSMESGKDKMEDRREVGLLPRLSFEEPGNWSLVEVFNTSGRDEEDRAGRQDWEVDQEKRKGGIVRRVSTCAQQ